MGRKIRWREGSEGEGHWWAEYCRVKKVGEKEENEDDPPNLNSDRRQKLC